MAYTSLGKMTISSKSPTLTADIFYERQRNGSDMQYRFKIILNGLLYADSRFGFNLKVGIKLDNVTKLSAGILKNTSPSYWSEDRPAVYFPSSTTWYTVSSKGSGSTDLSLNVFSDNGGGVDATKNSSLTVDPGKSTLTIPTITIGSEATLSVSKKSSSFTHTITYTFGAISGTICSKYSGTSVKWTPSMSMYKQIVGKSSGTIKFTIETFDGNTSLGSLEYSKTITPDVVYNSPSITNFTYERGSYSGGVWNKDQSGRDVKITYNVSFPVIAGNTVTEQAKIGENVLHSGNAINGLNTHYYTVGSLNSYNVVIALSDTVGLIQVKSLTIPTLSVPMNLNPELPGVAFGKIAEFEKMVDLGPGWKLSMDGHGAPVGEVIYGSAPVDVNVASGSNWVNIGNITLGPGVWILVAGVLFRESLPSATTGGALQVGISIDPTGTGDMSNFGNNNGPGYSTYTPYGSSTPPVFEVVSFCSISETRVYYLNARHTTGDTRRIQGRIKAVRIA